jgi:hypothetical protein
MGSGQLEDGQLDLYIGKISEPIFVELVEALPNDFLENAGTYRVPESKGIPLKLIISMRIGERTIGLEFYFGTESIGIPSEVIDFVRTARTLTEDWYRAQQGA